MKEKDFDELAALIGSDHAAQVERDGEAVTQQKENAGVATKEAEAEVEPEAEGEVEEAQVAPGEVEEVEAEAEGEVEAEDGESEDEAEPEAEVEADEATPTEVPESAGKEVEGLVQALTKEITESVAAQFDMPTLEKAFELQTKVLTSLDKQVKALAERVSEIERSDEQRIAEKMSQEATPQVLPWASFVASQSKETVVDKDDKITQHLPTNLNKAVANLASQIGGN